MKKKCRKKPIKGTLRQKKADEIIKNKFEKKHTKPLWTGMKI